MVVIGMLAMLFVGPYNCSRIIGAVKVEVQLKGSLIELGTGGNW